MKLGTSSHWVGSWTGAVVTATLPKPFLVAAHGSMNVSSSTLVCCHRCPWSHELCSKKIYTSVAVTPAPVWATCPEFHVGCRLGQKLFTLPTYCVTNWSLWFIERHCYKLPKSYYSLLNCVIFITGVMKNIRQLKTLFMKHLKGYVVIYYLWQNYLCS